MLGQMTTQMIRTWLFATLLALFIVEHAVAVQVDRHCAVNEPSYELLRMMRQMHRRDASLDKRSPRSPMPSVDTHIHVVMADGEREAGRVTDVMVADQINELRRQYQALGIHLHVNTTSVTTNTTWARNGDDYNMKAALRQGSYSSLNIYFQTQLARDPDAPDTTQFLGFSSLPDLGAQNPLNASHITDGCNIHAGTMPGGYVIGNNLGKTAVHEVGHWFGLLHTFWGYSCEGEGDLVHDTRQERTATTGCPRGKNSCPQLEGVDPITNFMDYSSDECYEGFTSGQVDRMFETFELLRHGH